MSNETKIKYQIENPIDWTKDKCCLCTFPFEINPTRFDCKNNEMSYNDFYVFKEHKFLRNIFSNEKHAKTKKLNNLKTFHETFTKFLKVVFLLQNALNSYDEFDEGFNETLIHFC